MSRLPLTSRYTLRKQLPAEILWQVFQGAAVAQFDIVARKGFAAPLGLIQWIFIGPSLAMIGSVYWGASMTAGRTRGAYLAVAALCGPALLLAIPWIDSPAPYVLCCVLSASAGAILVPFRNRLLQTNYAVEIRGNAWGRIAGLGQFAFIGFAILAGWVLDHVPDSHRFLFPAAGCVGLMSIFLYSRIRMRHCPGRPLPDAPRPSWWRDVLAVLGHEPKFLVFQAALMTYGFAIHILIPVNLILVNDVLGMSYREAALARQVIPYLLIAILFPLAGRFQDRTNPARVSVYSCAIFALYPLLLWVSAQNRSVPMAWCGYAVLGVAMALMMVVWELGPTWFAGKKDASLFMGIHVSLVGVRGSIGPATGVLLSQHVGLQSTYLLGSLLFAGASFVSWRLARRIETDAKETG